MSYPAYCDTSIKPIPSEINHLPNGNIIIPGDKFKYRRKPKNRVGQRFGRLHVIRLNHVVIRGIQHRYMYDCLCDCGNYVCTDIDKLVTGNTMSCGCLNKEINSRLSRLRGTHKQTKTRLYNIWGKMKQRCYDENYDRYKDYGLRHIKVCKDWREDFKSFSDWAYSHGYYDQPKDTPKADMLTIERIDVDGDYCPENCTWIPKSEQGRNRRNSIKYTFNNETVFLSDLIKMSELPTKDLNDRVYRGWNQYELALHILNPSLGLHKLMGSRTGYLYDKDGFIHLVNYKSISNDILKMYHDHYG